jgi:hypothetical protein
MHNGGVVAIDNYYDYEAGDWVTTASRYDAITSQHPFETVDKDALHDPRRGWPILLALLAAVPEDLIADVGCGPLENFIHFHGVEFAGELEREARENPRFRRAVINVNLSQGELPLEVEARLCAAFGPHFELMPPLPPDDEWPPDA